MHAFTWLAWNNDIILFNDAATFYISLEQPKKQRSARFLRERVIRIVEEVTWLPPGISPFNYVPVQNSRGAEI